MDYSTQAKALYGNTDAYKEYAQKSIGRTAAQENDLGAQVMDFFTRLGRMRPCEPDSKAALAWAKELQEFFTVHYYSCTPQILKSLAESYAGGGSMTDNINKYAGEGTAEFTAEAIQIYCKKQR